MSAPPMPQRTPTSPVKSLRFGPGVKEAISDDVGAVAPPALTAAAATPLAATVTDCEAVTVAVPIAAMACTPAAAKLTPPAVATPTLPTSAGADTPAGVTV